MSFSKFFTGLITTFFLSLLLSSAVFAQLDPTFGTNGVVQTSVYTNDSPVSSFALPDGKILVVNGSQTIFSLVRFNSNGSLDTTYGTNGVVSLNLPFRDTNPNFTSIYNVIRQPDGKLLFVGKDTNDGIIIRINENGTVDNTFGTGGVHFPNIDQLGRDEIHGVAVQPNGKIVVAGTTQGASGFPTRLFLLRYETNGTLDPTFGDGGYIVHNVATPALSGVVLQSTGKIITSGVRRSPSSVYRFNSDGSFDSGFTPININGDYATDLIVQPDDKILVADSVQKNDTLERVHRDVRVSRYNADGTVDGNFGIGGVATVDVAGYFEERSGEMALQPDGQIIVGAISIVTANRSTTFGNLYSLARFTANGTPNGKFLVTKNNYVSLPDVLILPNGKVLGITTIFLSFGNYDLFLAQVTGVPFQNYKFKGVPFDFGAILDGRADVSVFRQNQQRWYINPLSVPYMFGLPGDIPIPADYIKDYGAEMAVFRPSTGTWYIARDFANPGQNYIAVPWGVPGDIPIPLDYDGDSKADISVFRPSEGNWYIRKSSDNSATILRWGMNGDKPVAGDFDGDGRDDIAVWRPSTGVWYISKSSDGQPMFVHFGVNGDVPVQEDYDGDGKFDIAVWRPSNGVWYILRSSDGNFTYFQWGISTDIAVPADYDGDLKIDIGVFRPGNRTWYLFKTGTNSSDIFPYGLADDIPIQARN